VRMLRPDVSGCVLVLALTCIQCGSLSPVRRRSECRAPDGSCSATTVEVYVEEPDGRPAPQLYVELRDSSTNARLAAETDENGMATFVASPGPHVIEVNRCCAMWDTVTKKVQVRPCCIEHISVTLGAR
jgi:hypothetical protein